MPITPTGATLVDCQLAIQAIIEDLELDNIGQRVYAVRYPNEKEVTLPAVFVSWEGETEGAAPATNVADDWIYPVRVFFADTNVSNEPAPILREHTWRQTIMATFHNKAPLVAQGLPNIYLCRVVPRVIYDPKMPQYQYIVSGMVIQCLSRVVR